MLRVVFALLLIATFAFGYDDSDLDGVEDIFDRCPQTPFSELVDLNGCSIKNIDEKISFEIISGVGYSQVNYSSQQRSDTFTLSFESDVYMGDWSMELYTSKYYSKIENEIKSGFDDTALNVFYRYALNEKLLLNIGAGLILPTYESGYNNEKTDYAIYGGFEYFFDTSTYLFGNLSYTWIKDLDTALIKYQNISSFFVGMGYMLDFKNSLSLSYGYYKTIYRDMQGVRVLGVGYSYMIDSHWFICADYDYRSGEWSNDHSMTLRVGYGF